MPLLRAFCIALLCLVITPVHAKPGEPLTAQAWKQDALAYTIALYFLDKPGADELAAAAALAGDKRYGLKVVDRFDRNALSQPQINIVGLTDVAKEFAPPPPEMLKYYGRGLSREQVEALQTAPYALVMTFAHDASQGLKGLKRGEALVHELAGARPVVIWDEETRLAFTPDAWKKTRLDSWEGDNPDMSRQIAIHAYKKDKGGVRAITLGMARVGLPDLVIEETAWSLNDPLGQSMNALAQQLAEGSRPDNKGNITLDIGKLKHSGMRTRLQKESLKGATGRGKLRLIEGVPDEGDPDNHLASMLFDAKGKDVTQRQTSFVYTVFGVTEENIISTRHDEELLAASARAKTRLPALQKAFKQGLQPGEQLLVKAPFDTPDGRNEWMWVEVTDWEGDKIKGLLRNEPRYARGVQAGQIVNVAQSDVFDYKRIYPDGRSEGDETSALLMKR